VITINREPWSECIAELMPLCGQVFDLKEASFTNLPLDFDADLYDACEDVDRFHCLVMRLNGAPIGFHWIFISPMMRHKGFLHAHTDAIFVYPEHRRYSPQLIKYSENYIKDKAQFWTLANLDVTDRQAMWQRNGFEKIETIMFKKL
jgi:GNAT superfamily N-acetyltransferase